MNNSSNLPNFNKIGNYGEEDNLDLQSNYVDSGFSDNSKVEAQVRPARLSNKPIVPVIPINTYNNEKFDEKFFVGEKVTEENIEKDKEIDKDKE